MPDTEDAIHLVKINAATTPHFLRKQERKTVIDFCLLILQRLQTLSNSHKTNGTLMSLEWLMVTEGFKLK